MCIFSAPIEIVAGTCLLVGRTIHGKVRITYSNRVACEQGTIMVLPVDADAVELIELPKKYQSQKYRETSKLFKYLGYSTLLFVKNYTFMIL